MITKAVFLDRDGTINVDPGYLGNPDLVELYNGVPEGINKLKSAGFKIIVISNQSGIARKMITENDVISVNNKINELLSIHGTSIDSFYFCPYHPDFSEKQKCTCRKPSAEMIFDAAKNQKIDLTKSFMIGDSAIDVECGINANIETILVLNGKNDHQINILKKRKKRANFVAVNFLAACNFIIEKVAEESV